VRPGLLGRRRPHQSRLDTLATGVGEGEPLAPAATEGVVGVAQMRRVLARAQQAGDRDVSHREALGERLRLAQRQLGGGLGPAAPATEFAPRAALVDLHRDQDLVVGGARGRRLDQLHVGADQVGLERHRAVAA
jgi:hypothetical protein